MFSAHYTVNGHTIIIIGAILGQHGTAHYGLPKALTESRTLVQFARHNVTTYTPITAGQTIATINGTRITADNTITVLGWPGLTYRTQLHINPNPQPGQPSGTLDLERPDTHHTTTLTAQQ